MLTLTEAIDCLIEANVPLRKRRALAPMERQLERRMARAFSLQRRAFLSRLAFLKSRFEPALEEAVTPGDWLPLFDEAALESLRAFAGPLDEFTRKALQAGITALIGELQTDISLDLDHPAAVAYARDRAALRITQIQETTRTRIARIMTRATDEGWSYDRAAREIRRQYAEFSVTRARNIAVFELGDAYEAGNVMVAQQLQDAGLVMQKRWLSVGDDRVRPAHRANEGEGWLPLDATFSSGHDRPPTDPRCRCTLQMRRDPGADLPAPVPDSPPPADAFDRVQWNKDRVGFYEDWKAQLSEDEFEAVTRYKGARYKGINRMLRTGDAPASQKADLHKDVKLIDKALSKATLDRDIEAYRGVKFPFDGVPELWQNLQPGDVLTDPGFVSTSTAKAASERFAKKATGNFLMDVKIPKGSKGMWIDRLGDKATKEDEILLPRGTKFLVRSVKKERSGRTRLEVEVMQ